MTAIMMLTGARPHRPPETMMMFQGICEAMPSHGPSGDLLP